MGAAAAIDKLRGTCLLALLVAAPLQAEVLRVHVDRVATPAAVFEGVLVELDWPRHASHGRLDVRADALVLVDYEHRVDAVRWSCRLEREAAGDWRCGGTASAAGLGEARLQVDARAGGIGASLQRGEARLALAWPLADGPVPIELTSLPADWLQPLLAAAWPEAAFTGGRLGGRLQVDLSDPAATRIDGRIAIEDLGLDTRDGRIAAAALGARGSIALQLGGDAQRLEAELTISGGEVLAGAVYAALPADAVLALSAQGSGGRWALPRLHWRDAGVLQLDGEAGIDLEAEPPLQDLVLEAASANLASAHARYLETLLATVGLDGLALAGGAEVSLRVAGGDLQFAQLHLRAVDAVDGRGRFALRGAEGSVGWQGGSDPLRGALRWDAGAIYEIGLGAGSLHWESSGGRLALREPTAIPLLGGSLAVEALSWQPPRDDGGTDLVLAMSLAGVDLGDLGSAFGWPEFGGTLSGEIPSARYADGVLSLEGGLSMRAFDGRIDIGALRIERPFGVAPTLTADIDLRLLDLVPLTGAFGFGEISGRLDGRVHGLRLVDWEPVAFDAQFRTSASAPDKRRISQRAVRDLSSVGGGGLAGGIQAQVLRVFETFPYARIGLSCRLENHVCHMGGLEPRSTGSSGAGYTIVEGAGLPRITVVGHQRRVDWPVLVERLQVATAGQAPIVD